MTESLADRIAAAVAAALTEAGITDEEATEVQPAPVARPLTDYEAGIAMDAIGNAVGSIRSDNRCTRVERVDSANGTRAIEVDGEYQGRKSTFTVLIAEGDYGDVVDELAGV